MNEGQDSRVVHCKRGVALATILVENLTHELYMTTRVKEAKAKLTCDTFDVKAYNRNQGVRGPNMPIMHPDKKKTAHSGT